MFLFCFAAGFIVPSQTIQTENICSIPLIVGGCFIYKVIGLALFLTEADGTRELKRENEKSNKKNGESNKEGSDFPTWQQRRPQQN